MAKGIPFITVYAVLLYLTVLQACMILSLLATFQENAPVKIVFGLILLATFILACFDCPLPASARSTRVHRSIPAQGRTGRERPAMPEPYLLVGVLSFMALNIVIRLGSTAA